jgi:hypothetical protein
MATLLAQMSVTLSRKETNCFHFLFKGRHEEGGFGGPPFGGEGGEEHGFGSFDNFDE